ncbi:hypothetical protein EMIT0P44_130061 [Pseudomonas sp. IT-P44]
MNAGCISKCHYLGKTSSRALFRRAGFQEKAENLAADICLTVDWIRTPDNQRVVDESIKWMESDF